MECEICFEPYAESGGNKPVVSKCCGHTVCTSCSKKITKCPFDNKNTNGFHTNYALISALARMAPQPFSETAIKLKQYQH